MQTQRVIWETNFDEQIFQTPVYYEGLILVRPGGVGRIYALDSNSGNIVWQSDKNVASNIAVSNSVIYFLTMDARLVAVDVYTGQILGEVLFEPTNLTFQDRYGYARGYYVAANNNIIVVYLGDGRQLFAFRFS